MSERIRGLVKRLCGLVLAAALVMCSILWAAPDPDIFDGTKFPVDPQKRFSLGKILKSIGMGPPSQILRQEGGPSSSEEEGKGQEQGSRGQSQQNRDFPQSENERLEKQVGPSPDPNAVGSELAEAEEESSNDDNSSRGNTGFHEDSSQNSSSSHRRSERITVGAPSEMIEILGDLDDAMERADEEEEEQIKSSKPIVGGKSRGRSGGVERGEAIPSGL